MRVPGWEGKDGRVEVTVTQEHAAPPELPRTKYEDAEMQNRRFISIRKGPMTFKFRITRPGHSEGE